jgi:hypothetical protein
MLDPTAGWSCDSDIFISVIAAGGYNESFQAQAVAE